MESYSDSETGDCNKATDINGNSSSEKTIHLIVLSVSQLFLFLLLVLIKPLYDYRLTGSLSFDTFMAWANVKEAVTLVIMVCLVMVPVILITSRQGTEFGKSGFRKIQE